MVVMELFAPEDGWVPRLSSLEGDAQAAALAEARAALRRAHDVMVSLPGARGRAGAARRAAHGERLPRRERARAAPRRGPGSGRVGLLGPPPVGGPLHRLRLERTGGCPAVPAVHVQPHGGELA